MRQSFCIIRLLYKLSAKLMTKKKQSRSLPLSSSEIEEKVRLREIFFDRKRTMKFTQESFGRDYGIGSQVLMAQYLNGKKVRLNLEVAARFAKGLKCAISEFSPRLAALLHELELKPQTLSINDAELHKIVCFLQQPEIRQLTARLAQSPVNSASDLDEGNRKITTNGIVNGLENPIQSSDKPKQRRLHRKTS